MSTHRSRPPEDPRRRLGRLGEGLALTHLQRLGFTALARNARTRFGEIDLIVFDGEVLLFVEVKTSRVNARREGPLAEPPLARLRPQQRARVRRLASAWLADETRRRPRARSIRFDAVGVLVDSRDRLVALDHIENAF
jgi:putative endonuclease